MNYIVMDLEWNIGRHPTPNGYFDEIIEIGAVKLDEKLEFIGRFSSFVRPSVNKRLNFAVKNLTHIEIDALNRSENFKTVYQRFEDWCGQGNIFLTWSNMDILVMLRNLKFYGMGQKIACMDGYCDVQAFVQNKLQYTKNQMGLSAAAQLLGIDCGVMDMHRAADDAEVTARCFQQTYDKSFQACIQKAGRDFYSRLLFKNKVLIDYENPLIKKSSLMLRCPSCGRVAKRIEKFSVRNKYFVSLFRCCKCGKEYTGKVRVRLEYDGVSVISKMVEKEPSEVCCN